MTGADEKAVKQVAVKQPFIDGYVTQRWKKGDQPSYGYPTNHVPDSSGGTMDVLTGAISAGTQSI